MLSIIDKFNSLPDIVIRSIFIGVGGFFLFAFLFSLLKLFRDKSKNMEARRKVLFPEKYVHILENDPRTKEKKKKKKEFFLKKFYNEYCFFFKNGRPMIIIALVGYAIFVVIFYILSNSIPYSLIFAFSFDIIVYIHYDGKTTKARKKYIKDFASAINVLSTSTEAGNTFEKGIASIVQRDTIGERIRYEFSLISTDLKNNKPLEEALESFYKRNSGFQEIAMFVVVVQFFNKKGGDGLREIFSELSQSLTNKINNYGEIDAEIGIYKALMNFFIYGYFIILLVIKAFMPTFYPNLLDQGLMGYFKAFGSIVLYMFSIWFYRTMLRNSAEG